MIETAPGDVASGSASATIGDPARSRCRCPATSSSDTGRMRTARGVCPESSGAEGVTSQGYSGPTTSPSPEEVGELEQALKANGKTYEFHLYDGAGHAFLQVDRPSYRPEAAVEAWQRIWDFYGRYL